MIKKLRSRSPLDVVPDNWKGRPTVVGAIFVLLALLLVGASAGALALGVFTMDGLMPTGLNLKHVALIVLGGGTIVVALVAITIAATRENL